ncbi:MAG: ABC transporter permease [Chloracidobacterium sp.]|nr:ABC transporter permease [Chloracidobacterium sp.]
MFERYKKPYLSLIRAIGMVVPRRLRDDWRQEWEAELRSRETLLAEWDKLDWRNKLDLLRRSAGAFWDALLLQPRRLEDEMFQDLRYGARMLLKKPGFTIVAVITVALGIGANTVIFSGVYWMLFQPLPYPNAERLTVISQVGRQASEVGVSYPDFTAWKERSAAFERMAASSGIYANLTIGDDVAPVAGSRVSTGFFPLLGGRAQIGRVFLAEEYRPGAGKVVVLSDKLWQEHFGADPGVIGRTIKLDDQSYTVVGVMPPLFLYPVHSVLWTPLESEEDAGSLRDATDNHYSLIGALKPGVSLDAAAKEMATLAKVTSQQKPAGQPELTVKVARLRDTIRNRAKYRTPIFALQFAVLFVLLIASVNLANLLLARNAARRQEFTIRMALGAGRGRLARQLLVESLLLGLFGNLIGLLLGAWGLRALQSIDGIRPPDAGEVEINAPVLLITLFVSLLTSLAFGIGPAIMASRQDLNECLKTSGAPANPRRRRLSGFLVAAEVALAVALLTGSGLMIRTVLNLTNEDPGFNPKYACAVKLYIPLSNSKNGKDGAGDGSSVQEILDSYFDEALRRIRALPGVESVGGVAYPPMVGYNPGVDFTIGGRAAETELRADIQPITPDYFQAMGIPLLRGRPFTEAEMRPQPEAAIVNNAFARKFWPNGDPMGKHILLQDDNLPRGPLVVVGLAGDVKQFGLATEPRPEIYLPMRRNSMTLIVRTSGNPAQWAAAVRETIQRLDNRTVIGMRTLEEMVDRTAFSRRTLALLMGILGAVALLLAAMGIYGVISYMVAQRTREMGVRLALGAQRHDLLKLVLGQGVKLTTIGVAAGLALALAITRFLSSMLYGVSAADPITFASIASLFAVVALTASYLPARRAMKVDPITTLRQD